MTTERFISTTMLLMFNSGLRKKINLIEVFQVKYLNNIIEQSHRKVKGKMRQFLGWKSDEGVSSTLSGVELWSIIKNGQLDNFEGLSDWEQFYALTA